MRCFLKFITLAMWIGPAPRGLADCPQGLYVQDVVPILAPSGVPAKVLAVEGVVWVVQSGVALKFTESGGRWAVDSIVTVPAASMDRFDARRSVCLYDGYVFRQAAAGAAWSAWWTFSLGINGPSWNYLGARFTSSSVVNAYSGAQSFYNWQIRPLEGGAPSTWPGEAEGNQLMVSSDSRVGVARVWNAVGTFAGIGPRPALVFRDADISDTLAVAIFATPPNGAIVMASTLGVSEGAFSLSASGHSFIPAKCAAGTTSVFGLGDISQIGAYGALVEFRAGPTGAVHATQELPLSASGPIGADGDGLIAVTRSNPAIASGRELVVVRRHQPTDCDGDGVADCEAIGQGAVPDFNENGIPDPCECIADLFPNGEVNGADLGILLSQWGQAAPQAVSDLNRDGAVDGADLGYLLSRWGQCSG